MSPIYRQVGACLAALVAACMLSSTVAAAAAEVAQPLEDVDGHFRPLNSKADFGYVDVRHGARMFWTLEPCTGCHHMSIFEEPLIIWLQGGPGASGSGYGNFMVNASAASAETNVVCAFALHYKCSDWGTAWTGNWPIRSGLEAAQA